MAFVLSFRTHEVQDIKSKTQSFAKSYIKTGHNYPKHSDNTQEQKNNYQTNENKKKKQ